MDFSCVAECSKCCITREYYPTVKFGKVGVLILPEEKKQMELFAKKNGTIVTILPRIGVSEKASTGPETILAYQMMGRDQNGDRCPFLDIESKKRSPHGGFACKIYENRPLACRAYPVIESSPIHLDSKCKFCEIHGTSAESVDSELESLIKIKKMMKSDASYIWRYATGVGELRDKDLIENGWFLV